MIVVIMVMLAKMLCYVHFPFKVNVLILHYNKFIFWSVLLAAKGSVTYARFGNQSLMESERNISSACILLYHDIAAEVCFSSQVRFVARLKNINHVTQTLSFGCPEHDRCDLKLTLSGSLQFAETHGLLSKGDLMEVVGTINMQQDFPVSKDLYCECLILRNVNGMDYNKYKKSLKLLGENGGSNFNMEKV